MADLGAVGIDEGFDAPVSGGFVAVVVKNPAGVEVQRRVVVLSRQRSVVVGRGLTDQYGYARFNLPTNINGVDVTFDIQALDDDTAPDLADVFFSRVLPQLT